MSLQLIAKEMESKGRKGDSMLVHMTPGEVAGLQKLAETAGGSLSVNPETGLVEANFLKSMLPTIVGLAVGVGTGNPMLGAAAGAAMGGYRASRSGQDVGMGMVMGGMGGYGGASLASGLSAAAPAAVGVPTSAAVVPGAGAGIMAPGAATSIASAPAAQAATQAVTAPTMAENFARLGQGFQGMSTEAGRAAALKSMGGSQGIMNAMQMAALPAAYAAPTESAPQNIHPILSSKIDYRTPASPEVSAYQGGKPRSTNVPIPAFRAAQGGLLSLAEGGSTGFLSSSVTDDAPFANMPVYRDLEAYEGPMPNYIYQGRNIYTRAPARRAPARRAPVTQLRPAPVVPVIAPPVQAPVVNPFISQPVIETGGGEGYGPNPDFVTPEQQAAYYAENPAMGRFTRALQDYNPFASLQERMDPGFVTRQADIALSGVKDAGIVDGGLDRDPQQRAQMAAELAGIASQNDVGDVTVGGPAPATNLGGISIDGGEPGSGVDGMDGDGSNPSGDVGGESGPGVDSMAQGGLMSLAKGGMRSGGFVIPADVVSMIGEGNTDAGYKRIKSMVPGATAIKGKDGGQSDTVKTSIEGKQPARVAHGEMYVPPETVKRMGGAKKLYAMMDRVRQQATGSKKQIKPVSLKRAMA
jgi:hypothetical protein